MRVTVCELPHEPAPLETAWRSLCAHAAAERSDLVVLPELSFVEPFWERERFDPPVWAAAEALSAAWMARLAELGVERVIGTRPITIGSRRVNQGYLWTRASGVAPLREKHWLPDEPGGFEARWFDRGSADFVVHHAGELGFALMICSELWALETHPRLAREDVAAIVAPRATAAATTDKWLALGTVAAVGSGAYCLSSNRVAPDGRCGGVGWIIDPDGAVVARTSPHEPHATRDVDVARSRAARATYPRYVFAPR